MRCIAGSAVALILVGLLGAARAEMSVDEARKLAEKHAGHSLADARVMRTRVETLEKVGFRDARDGGVEREYTVDLTHG